MDARPALDPREILRAIGIEDPDSVAPVTGGMDTAIWRVGHRENLYALRVFRPEQAPGIARETAAMIAAAAAGIPVPRLVQQGVWNDRPVLLLGWSPGQTVAQTLMRQPWRAWSVGDAFGQVQARLHRVAAPPVLAEKATAWIDLADWKASSPSAQAINDKLRAQLLEQMTPQPKLIHLDYHPLNVLIVDGQVSAVLDWTNARAGDPRADIARTATILRLSQLPGGRMVRLIRILLRVFEAGWLTGYQRESGPLKGMGPYYTWAGKMMLKDRPGDAGQRRKIEAWIERWSR